MASYEVEHNIKAEAPRRARRPDMSTFTSRLAEIDTRSNNTDAPVTPADMASAYHLASDFFSALASSSTPDSSQFELLESLNTDLLAEANNPPDKIMGVSQEYIDSLERVSKKELQKLGGKEGKDECPICGEKFLDDEYPLVVRLPCHESHRFDLECIAPWIKLKGTCPLDRKELEGKKKEKKEKTKEEDEEDYYDVYG